MLNGRILRVSSHPWNDIYHSCPISGYDPKAAHGNLCTSLDSHYKSHDGTGSMQGTRAFRLNGMMNNYENPKKAHGQNQPELKLISRYKVVHGSNSFLLSVPKEYISILRGCRKILVMPKALIWVAKEYNPEMVKQDSREEK